MRLLSTVLFTASILFLAIMVQASNHFDFRAFYCAGRVARLGSDPYRNQPLYTCEQTRTETNKAWLTNGPLPAPFPPYVITVIFEPLSLMTYRVSVALWMIALFAALGVSIMLLAQIGGCRPSLPAAALTFSAGIASLYVGEVVPFFFLSLCCSIYALRRSWWNGAALCACGTLIEPHLGIPVCLALALFQPSCRLSIAAGVSVLSAVSLSAFGFRRSLEFVYPVLHYHALSEIGSDKQFAFSTVLHWLGIADGAALALGMSSYVVAALLGILIATELKRRYAEPAFLVATPAAFALLGGVFLHATQMIAALPLALLLLRVLPRAKIVIACAMGLLAIPWVWQVNWILSVVAVFVALAVPWEACRSRAWTIAAAPALCCAIYFWISGAPPIIRATPRVPVTIDAAYAERGWADQVARYDTTGSVDAWARRAPTWAGLISVLGVAFAAGAARRRPADRALTLPTRLATVLSRPDA